ncbi:hypothetical protein PRIPAC_70786 [Pristionchus pacificus]|uniref:Uncharacterized protein n=1 Tax=Pristionchus pacificus TaxID=54126 RepID=A0A2A6C6Q7_PRIPA|nr:hypothetical protein PRIPAC_70786 [Pristionchus pacificus]|eukprot:PDM73800.1 hypothetical protein PRIPAC_41156 [Pristionchus pacificus]
MRGAEAEGGATVLPLLFLNFSALAVSLTIEDTIDRTMTSSASALTTDERASAIESILELSQFGVRGVPATVLPALTTVSSPSSSAIDRDGDGNRGGGAIVILYHDLRYGPTTTDKFVGKDNGIFTTTSKNVRESEEIVEKIERSLVKRGL